MIGYHGFGDRGSASSLRAAMLHDVGDYVRYDSHHKHSYYLILNSDIMGLTPDERAIVANVALTAELARPFAHPELPATSTRTRGRRSGGLAAILPASPTRSIASTSGRCRA